MVEAVKLQLLPHDRVLVLGASGWFGQTFRELLPAWIPSLLLASEERAEFLRWDNAQVAHFAPTVVANFAFLTRERVASEGEARFREINELLTSRFIWAASLASVRAALTVSSGAAVSEPVSPYGSMKRAEEQLALELGGTGKSVVVGRAYSVSGGHVRRPHDYAFSDFVLQARTGTVRVNADRPVLRRYVSVADFLTVCMQLVLSGWTGVIESGGELIEIGDLARTIVKVVNPAAAILRPELATSQPASYASDNASWTTACRRLGFSEKSLKAQVEAVQRTLT